MSTRVWALFLVLTIALGLAGNVLAGPGDDAAAKAAAWLGSQQNADGGFASGFAPGSDVGSTADAIVALASLGQGAGAWKKNDRSPLDWLTGQVQAGKVTGAGKLAKTIMAVKADGGDPHNTAGVDLVAQLKALHKAGSFGGTLFDDALAVLALASAREPVPEEALKSLEARQTADGAWAFTGDTAAGAGDTNTTALTVQALFAAGRRQAVGRAIDYFRRTQNKDAGWPYQVPSPFGTETDANSTAYVLQALIAAGEKLSDWSVAGKSDPVGALVSLQDAKTGAFNYQASSPGANLLATIQAIPALKGVTLARVPVMPAGAASGAPSSVSGAGSPPTTLPVSGAPIAPSVLAGLALLGLGILVAFAGWLFRRSRVR